MSGLAAPGKVEKEAAPGFALAGFLRWFSWWHFKPTKIIAGDGPFAMPPGQKDRKFSAATARAL